MAAQFISEYGTTIIYAVLVALAGFLGTQLKALYERYINDKRKADIAKTVVKAVQQLYKDLEGEEKYQKALDAASEMLKEKGITVTQLELQMLIESAVAEFKDAFNRTEGKNGITA